MEKCKKGDWVQISRVILEPGERAPSVPPETAAVPLTMKVKGFLLEETAELGDSVSLQTVTGREVSGRLLAVNPSYGIDFGVPQAELLKIGVEVRKILREGVQK